MILYLGPKVWNFAFFLLTPSLFASHLFLEMGLFLFCKSLTVLLQDFASPYGAFVQIRQK